MAKIKSIIRLYANCPLLSALSARGANIALPNFNAIYAEATQNITVIVVELKTPLNKLVKVVSVEETGAVAVGVTLDVAVGV
jgi:hypothetical protein